MYTNVTKLTVTIGFNQHIALLQCTIIIWCNIVLTLTRNWCSRLWHWKTRSC